MKEKNYSGFHSVQNLGESSTEDVSGQSEDGQAEYLRYNDLKKEKKKYQIKPGFILRKIAGEYMIVPTDEESLIHNAILAPNDTAVFLWKAFEQPSTIHDVVVRGMREYEVTEDTIRRSVEQFVKESLEYKILEEVG